ncbi:NAD-dependent epimerase/dehydratase family protein [Streptomyces sp. NPDC091972]|uniref:NAD-dependent epimerase/dehydratase family protein n=1 Tax=Streptomyces sp. NPDC091972 TaxID=3366007 RepID=UPI00381BA7CB
MPKNPGDTPGAPSPASDHQSKKLLVLGGTGWLGGLVAEAALAQGTDVTCLARGTTGAVPTGARLVRADRTSPHAYDEVIDTDWDEVVDVTWQPVQAQSAVEALANRVAHWTYVSSGAVHMAGARRPTNIPAQRRPGGAMAREPEYPAAKLACERAVLEGVGDRAAIVRVGLVGGPGDVSDRTGYWPGRFALAGNGPVLVPDAGKQPVRFIDARDFAYWLAGPAATHTGVFQAQGPVHTLGEVLAAAALAADFSGRWVLASPERLAALDIVPWMGKRALPLWATSSFGPPRSADEAVEPMAPGLVHRSLQEVMHDTLQDEIRRGLSRDRKSGLSRADELAAIQQIDQEAGTST